jgi:lipid-A-disaccharide synthase
VGHPLIDAIHHPIVDSTKFRIENQLDDKPIIAYFQEAGSKITKMLAVMLSIVEDFPDYQFVIAGAQVSFFL